MEEIKMVGSGIIYTSMTALSISEVRRICQNNPHTPKDQMPRWYGNKAKFAKHIACFSFIQRICNEAQEGLCSMALLFTNTSRKQKEEKAACKEAGFYVGWLHSICHLKFNSDILIVKTVLALIDSVACLPSLFQLLVLIT